MNNQELYQQVCLHGIYYNPASKHYGLIGTVNCDRCYKSNLDVCIGYKEADLCLQCIQELCRKRTLFDPLAPYGYDKNGKRRNHWCTTMEH